MNDLEKKEKLIYAFHVFMEIGDICDFYDAVSDVREINGYDISQYYEKHSSVLKLSAKKIETSISLNIPLDDQLHRISNGFDKYVDIVNKVEMRIQRAKEIVNSFLYNSKCRE